MIIITIIFIRASSASGDREGACWKGFLCKFGEGNSGNIMPINGIDLLEIGIMSPD
jgi:hypothetical protein